MLGFTRAIDQSEARTQACHVSMYVCDILSFFPPFYVPTINKFIKVFHFGIFQ